MYGNRFFPEMLLTLERLEQHLSYLLIDDADLPTIWYRARIQEEDVAYTIDEMGTPPKHRAGHGRANPAGIPYLYLASTIPTAISELRPHTGETASVAEFSVEPGLKIVDLRQPRGTISPFMLEDENEVALLRGDIGFFGAVRRGTHPSCTASSGGYCLSAEPVSL